MHNGVICGLPVGKIYVDKILSFHIHKMRSYSLGGGILKTVSENMNWEKMLVHLFCYMFCLYGDLFCFIFHRSCSSVAEKEFRILYKNQITYSNIKGIQKSC